ncbi:MAG: BatA domain-containing protein [Candidatus Coatesbacteria bacterium]|nr:MAG: BatA domain-containing protein [Candidatus Coatesbacteria bacterium]
MISFLQPLYLLLLPLAAVPWLLNLIKRRVRVRVLFPSVQLLRTVEERRARRRPRWYELLLLALRVAAIAVLVLMLAQPRFTPSGSPPPRAVVVIIDNSPSMEYVEGGESRLARAVRFASALAATAGPEDLGVVLWTGSERAGAAWGKLAEAGPAGGVPPAEEGSLAEALVTAVALAASPETAGRTVEIAVFTDMQGAAFEAVVGNGFSLPAGGRFTFYDVRADSTPRWNVALTAYRLVPAAGGTGVVVEVRQYGRPRPVTVTAAGGLAREVPAGARGEAKFEGVAAGPARFECPGGYPFDDVLTAELPPPMGVTAAVGDFAGAGMWRAALAAGQIRVVAPEELSAPAILVVPAAEWEGSAAARATAERGSIVVIVPEGPAEMPLGEGARWPVYSPGAARASFAAAFPLARAAGDFDVGGARAGELPAPWEIAAATAEGRPVVASRRWGRGEVYALALPPGREYSNFYTSPAFVGFAFDLKFRAIGPEGVAGARSVASAESDPEPVRRENLEAHFPNAVVTRHEPRGKSRSGAPLSAAAAAAVFLLLAAEAVAAAKAVTAGPARAPSPGRS